MSQFKSGFVTILGKPNVGKSSLLNEILKEKVSIVSPKAQTTRNSILGIYNDSNSQIVFTDTPGINITRNKLDQYMQKKVVSAREGVDVILVVLDGTKTITDELLNLVKAQEHSGADVIVVVNKVDATTFEKLYPQLNKLNSLNFVKEIIPTSAHTGQNVKVLVNKIKELLPEGVKYYDEDIYTDKTEKFLVAEMIREKTLRLLNEEIPHGIAVEIAKFDETKPGVVVIDADLVCERQSHKIIIIGENGQTLKKIGVSAREDIEILLDAKVFLNLFVKVRKNWRSNAYYVKDLGYNENED